MTTADMKVIDKLALAVDTLLAFAISHNSQLNDTKAALSDAQSKLAASEAAQKASDDKATSLQQQVDDLEAKVASELDPSSVEDLITKVQNFTSANADAPAVEPAPTAPAEPAEPVSVPVAPVVTVAPSGMVTVDAAAGTSTHVADADGTSTVVDHESGSVTAKDIDGNPIPATQAAVDETVDAMKAAGVPIPVS